MKDFYCCSNSKYKTDTQKGYQHKTSGVLGSVFIDPIIEKEDGATLWLEYVIEVQKNQENEILYWFMWYDNKGTPIINQSGVFNREDLVSIFKKILDLKNEVL